MFRAIISSILGSTRLCLQRVVQYNAPMMLPAGDLVTSRHNMTRLLCVKFTLNPFSGFRVVTCEKMDRHGKANM